MSILNLCFAFLYIHDTKKTLNSSFNAKELGIVQITNTFVLLIEV